MEQVTQILLSIAGAVATILATWLTTLLTTWLNSKIKDKKLAAIASSAAMLVLTVVKEVFQTYVEALKKAGTFNADAQAKAKQMAIDKVKSELTSEQTEYIKNLGMSVEDWISQQIESSIYSLKQSAN